MKILIAAASFSSNISGLQRHALNVARCLLRQPDVSAVHLVVAPWQRKMVQASGLDSESRLTSHIADMDRGSLSRNLSHYRQLPQFAASVHADVVHLSYPVPVNAALFACPTVVTLHDLYPYEIPLNFGFPHVIFNRLILRQCLRSVDAIACVSEITKLRLKQYVPGDAWRKAVTIYNCIEPATPHATKSPIPGWHSEPFLLCIAQHRRNKNIPLLIRAFDRLLRAGQIDRDTKLLIVGITGPETRRIHSLVTQYRLESHVHFLEGLSEPDLQWCYWRCEALAAPSITEGFGLPVAEALLAGCRVVCSDIPAFREVGGEHCRFVALGKNDEEVFADAMVATLREPAKGPVALPQFSGQVLAEQYLSLYRRLIASDASTQNATYSAAVPATTSEGQSL